jgi:hypothetical protein
MPWLRKWYAYSSLMVFSERGHSLKTNTARFLFDSPGVYRILIAGPLPAQWADSFGGMTICVSPGKPRTTTLTGVMIDQARLIAVLTELYDLGCTLLEVVRLPSPIASEPEGAEAAHSQLPG